MPVSVLPAKNNFVALGPAHHAAIEAYIGLMKLKNYSEATITTYRHWFIIFLCHFPKHKPSTITKHEVMGFLLACRNSEKWSAAIQNQLINAVKFFYEQLLKRPKEFYDLPRAQKPQQLPAVFAEEEVKQLIYATENLKHRSMLCLAYAGGLRVSEIVNVKLTDVDSKRMVITLRQAKGKKDRQVMLSEKLLLLLREYFKKFKPKHWLFEGSIR